MTSFDLIAALALPDAARVDRRVPKTLLVDNAAQTAADKRRIRDGVAEIRWLAALKPTTVGLAAYRNSVREVLEIAVLQLSLLPGARPERPTELLHRAIPYPVLLLTLQGNTAQLSLAQKRWSLGEAGKTVLDGDVVTADMGNGRPDSLTSALFDTLALTRRPNATLYTLYQAWIEAVQALCAARVTGVFSIPASTAKAADRAAALQDYERLEARISHLSAAGTKEKQMSRLAEINIELKSLRADRDAARARL